MFERPEVVTNPEGKPTLILQAGSHYEYVGRLRFTLDAGAVKVVSYKLLPVDERVRPLPQVQAVVDELKRGIVDTYGDVYELRLATAVCDLETATEPNRPERDSAMGDLITDALRAKTGTDIAITANGLISEGIFKGPIVGIDLFRPVSYGYDPATGLGLKIATFRITGAELVKGLETGLAYLGVNEDFFLQVSGMSFAYDPRAEVGLARADRSRSACTGSPSTPIALHGDRERGDRRAAADDGRRRGRAGVAAGPRIRRSEGPRGFAPSSGRQAGGKDRGRQRPPAQGEVTAPVSCGAV